MKDRIVIDLRQIMDDIFEATKSFGDAFNNGMRYGAQEADRFFHWDDKVDYYPAHSYPPTNVYLTKEKTLIFEFALAGFSEKEIELQFQGDYMVLSASLPEQKEKEEEKEEKEKIRYFKHRLKVKNIKEQKYYVPEAKFDRSSVKAVYKNGLLTITIPANEEEVTKEGIKIKIVKETEVKK